MRNDISCFIGDKQRETAPSTVFPSPPLLLSVSGVAEKTKKNSNGNFSSGNAVVRRLQRESAVVLGLNRRLQLPHRLRLERPLRPLPPSTPLQVSLSPSSIQSLTSILFGASMVELRWCRVASTVDAVLLSHPDTLHLGALPYAMKQLGLSAPVFSTEPVYRLGLLTMYDQFLSRKVAPQSIHKS